MAKKWDVDIQLIVKPQDIVEHNELANRDEALDGIPVDANRNKCPVCKSFVAYQFNFCPFCGQRVEFKYGEQSSDDDRFIEEDRKVAEIEKYGGFGAYAEGSTIGFDDPEFDKFGKEK